MHTDEENIDNFRLIEISFHFPLHDLQRGSRYPVQIFAGLSLIWSIHRIDLMKKLKLKG